VETTKLIKLIKTRRSIRSFQDKPVPEALLIKAIEAAIWAPNGSNYQNWRFFIILDKKVINIIADAVQMGVKTIMSWPEMADAGPPPRIDVLLRKIPALIVVATVRSSNPDPRAKKSYGDFEDDAIAKRANTDPEAKKMFERYQVGGPLVQSTSAAVAYLILVLHQMGLGSLWMAGNLYTMADIEKILKFPAGMDVVTLVAVGYPAVIPTKDRKPLNEVCQIITNDLIIV